MVKAFKNLIRNQNADDFDTWYAALGTKVLPYYFQLWPWVDLDLFYDKVNLVPYSFICERVKTMDFSEAIVVFDIKFDRWIQLNEP